MKRAGWLLLVLCSIVAIPSLYIAIDAYLRFPHSGSGADAAVLILFASTVVFCWILPTLVAAIFFACGSTKGYLALAIGHGLFLILMVAFNLSVNMIVSFPALVFEGGIVWWAYTTYRAGT